MNSTALNEAQPIDILNDGDLVYTDPKKLLDLSVDGNVRKAKRNEKKYAEIKESIRRNGVTQPLIVRYNKERTELELIAGYGRKDIAIELRLDSVPVLFRDVDDAQALAIAAEENIMREDMCEVDEINFAKLYVSMHDGDHQLAANSSGWEVSKIRSRMQLTRCTQPVLDALADNKIYIGHATLLSVLTETIQNNTLEKIMLEGWTIDTLKLKLGKVQNSLQSATFDTSDCELCQHNSNGIQKDIFSQSTGVVEGKCNNNTCYQKKTTQALQSIKNELEERVGNVIFLTETSKKRNTVTKDVVGSEQFQSGCTNCSKRFTILDDRAGFNGATIDNQCMDNECFNGIIEELKKDNIEAEVKANQSTKKTERQDSAKKRTPKASKTAKKKPKKIRAEFSQPLQAAMRKQIRSLTCDHLYSKQVVQEAIMTVALNKLAGIRNDFGENNIAACFDRSIDELKTLQNEAIKHYLFESPASERYIIDTYRSEDKEQAVLKSSWKPTKELLALYTKTGLKTIAEMSGFDKWYDDRNIENKSKTFSKLMGLKKTEVIDQLMTDEFDWADYVPVEFSTVKSS